jgi:HAE1 family hydrophobic/amphiphilic exporter-1
MTAVSTLLGIFPLAIATGAGAASCQSLGTAVFGGMVVATVLSLFFVPILYIVIVSAFCRFKDSCRDITPEGDEPRDIPHVLEPEPSESLSR